MKRLLAVVVLGTIFVPAASSAQVVFVQGQVEPPPAVVVMPAQEEYVPVHQLQAGIGVPICYFAGVDSFGTASSCVNDEFLLLNIPIVYRYRINDWMAAGGGLMLNIFALGSVGAFGIELVGSFRFYALPDWVYIDANILLGFPWVTFMPSIGVAIPLGPVSIFLENQIWLSYLYALGSSAFFGWWQPTIGVEFFF